ncbi:MAG: alpha/beta fold hydrolase [bacterium]
MSPSKSFADTSISSDITQDTHWTLDASPYIVKNNIDIGDTATLTIDSGVQVLFVPNAHIQVDGAIVAQGTTDNHIVFDTQTPDTAWGGFIFSTVASGDFLYTDFAHTGTAISADDADIAVQQTTFTSVKIPAQITFATRFVHTGTSFVQTGIQGWKIVEGSTIADSNTLTGGDGSYSLYGRSTVSEGTDLAIDLGAILYFADGADMLVLGSIHIQGNPDSHVQFDGNKYEIVVYGGDAVFSYIDMNSGGVSLYDSTATISHTAISGANTGVLGDTSTLHIDNISILDCDIGIYVFSKSHIDLIDSSVVSSTNNAIVLADTIATFTNTSIDITTNTAISISNTNLSLNTVHIKNANTGISGFDASTLHIQDSDIDKASWMGIMSGNSSTAQITNTEIKNGNAGITIYPGSSLVVSHVKIHDVGQGIETDGQQGSTVSIQMHDSEIYNTTAFALRIFDQSADSEIKNNSIHDTNNLNVLYIGPGLDISKNWWGTKDGPSIDSFVPDPSVVNFAPFLRHDPKNSRVPVIIIPGISGTQLLKAYDNNEEIWPSLFKLFTNLFDHFLNPLSLKYDGTEDPGYHIVTGDIIRSAAFTHTFDYLIADLKNKDGYVENTDLFVFPYDWRFDSKTSADKLKQKIDQVMQDTGYDSIDIIAHSMGGLITKRYIAEYGDQNIDNLFFVGTPHLGAPKAFKALMYGDNLGIGGLGINILSQTRIKSISQNMPSIYELLPSAQFGSYVSLNTTNLDIEDTKNLMINSGRNADMFNYADILHNMVDNTPIYKNTHVYDFAGCSTKTIQNINITKGAYFPYIEAFSIGYVEGDETVPLKSANFINQGQHFYSNIGSHAELPSVEGIRNAIVNILSGKSIDTNNSFSSSPDICLQSGTSIENHSPVTLQIYDDKGNHTGPLPDGSIEYSIPNVTYNIIEDQKYAYLPDGPQYKIVNTAEHMGTYDMYIHKIDTQDVVTSSAYFTKLPIDSLSMKAHMDISAQNTSYSVALDENGDGVVDSTVFAKDSLSTPIISQIQNHGGIKPIDVEKDKTEIIISKEEKQGTIPEKLVVLGDKKTGDIKHKKVQDTKIVQSTSTNTLSQNNTLPEIPKKYPWYVRVLQFIKKLIIL